MWDLRLTCRKVNHKTYDFYAGVAFWWLSIHLDYQGLQRLTEISQRPVFAEKVETLLVAHI